MLYANVKIVKNTSYCDVITYSLVIWYYGIVSMWCLRIQITQATRPYGATSIKT
jgi:hypothetical protein